MDSYGSMGLSAGLSKSCCRRCDTKRMDPWEEQSLGLHVVQSEGFLFAVEVIALARDCVLGLGRSLVRGRATSAPMQRPLLVCHLQLQGLPGWGGLEVARNGVRLLQTLCPTLRWVHTKAWLERETGDSSKCLQQVAQRGRVSERANGVDSRECRGWVRNGGEDLFQSVDVRPS